MRRLLAIAFIVAAACGEEVVTDPYRLTYTHVEYALSDVSSTEEDKNVLIYRFDTGRRFLFKSGLISEAFALNFRSANESQRIEISRATDESFYVGNQKYVFRPIARQRNACGEYVMYDLEIVNERSGLGELECEEYEVTVD